MTCGTRYTFRLAQAVSPLPREGRELLYQLWRSLGGSPADRAENIAKCAPGRSEDEIRWTLKGRCRSCHTVTAPSLTEAWPQSCSTHCPSSTGTKARRSPRRSTARLNAWHFPQARRCLPSIRFSWECSPLPTGWSDTSDRWIVNLTWHEAAPKLLGLEPLPDAQSCTDSSTASKRPSFYVYDTGDYARPLLSCASGMEGSEVMLHRFLLRSRCRTLSPDDADFFYVPFYSFCFQLLSLHLAESRAHRATMNSEPL